MKRYLLILSSVLFFFVPINKTQAQDIVTNGANTKPINFPAGSCTYTWTNNNPSIGLAANGTGNIPSFKAVNTGSTPVTATITGTPVGLSGFAYIVNAGSDNVSVINVATSAVVAIIPVGSNPNAVCVDPNYNEVYVVNNSSNTVSVINTLTNTVTAKIPVGPSPWSVTVSPDGSRAYVADGGNNDVEVINTTTNTIVDKIPAGSNPNALAVSPDGSLIYVNNSNSVTVINATTHVVAATIPVGSAPQAILITPDGSKVYEANYASGNVYVINTATNQVTGIIPVGVNPGGGSMSPDGSVVYIANEGSNNVSVISTATDKVIKTIPVGASPWGVSVRPDGTQIYVANSGSNSVSVVDASTNAIITNIPVGSEPYSFGNFFTGGMNCTELVKYTITVNPSSVSSPTITAAAATGTISSCAGTASASPEIQRFIVSGTGLTAGITATAPVEFELSLAPGSGYASSVTIPQTSGAIINALVYVRSAASAPAGGISGNVTLTSIGANNQTVAVTGEVNALPTVNAGANQTVNNGATTAAVNFTGTGNTFTWVNDTPGIGLAASGTGDIASFTAINKGSSPVVATITTIPTKIGFAYIADFNSGYVIVYNTLTNQQVALIRVGPSPLGISLSPDGSRVYVSNNGFTGGPDNTISVINTATNTTIATVTVGSSPGGIITSPDGSRVYVANQMSNTISVISTATNTVIATIPDSPTPNALALSPDGSRLYVAQGSNQMSVINTLTNMVIATFTVSSPAYLAMSKDGNFLYGTNPYLNTVSVISTTNYTVVKTIPVGSFPFGISISPDGSKIYVTNESSNNVSVINTSTNLVEATINVGANPNGVSVSPDGTLLYVVNTDSENFSVINTQNNLVTATIPLISSSYSFGNFVSGGTSCPGIPIKFTITVNPTFPTITASTATGAISACVGTASASPQIQQFTVSGSNLTGNITAAAPTGFEISLAAGNGYSNSLTLNQAGGTAASTVVYVRSAATGTAGDISGNITLTSAGAGVQTVAVTGTVNALPTVNAVANQTVNNGANTAAVNFTGTGNTFTWVNDTPGIGLAANGSGNIASFTAINNGNSPVVATVTVTPNSAGGFAYVTNYASGTVSVINTANNALVTTIPVGSGPFGITVSLDGSRVYVTNRIDNTISVINTLTNTVIATASVGRFSWAVSVGLNDKYVYVTNSQDNTVSVIDNTTNSLVTTINVDSNPIGVSRSPDGALIFVPCFSKGTICVISTATNKVVSIIPVSLHIEGIIVSPDGSRLYVSNGIDNVVYVIDATTYKIIATVGIGSQCFSMAISPDGSRVYTANQADNTISVINTSTDQVVSTITSGLAPSGISVTSDGKWLYVTNQGENTVSVINSATGTTTSRISVGVLPISFGNFITPHGACTGAPITFTITVNPSTPTITVTAAAGVISACTGSASASPDIQQFTVSGSGLTGSITATAPVGFELSLTAGSGYGSSVIIPQAGGAVGNTIVYVRSATTASAGSISGNVTLTSAGASNQTVAVTGTVNPIATASLVISASGNNICAGTPVTFTAAPANGGSSPVYQWLLNGNNAGTNSPTFSSNTLADGDLVNCVMMSSSACVTPAITTSNSIVVKVTGDVVPSISIVASQNTICARAQVTFTASPTNGGASPVYQWLLNGNNAGTNSSTFSSNTFANGDVVSCVMTSNGACATPASVTSNRVNISVNPFVSPAISITASQNNICPGTNITFTATPANGGSSPVYQWLVNGNNAGTNSPMFSSSTLSNGDVIGCRLTSNATCLVIADVTSNDITMIVNAQVVPTVSITISANNVCAGTPVTFTASPTDGGASPVYQWLLNGNNAGTNSPTFSSDTFANGDAVSCVVTSNADCATPASATSNSIITNIFPLPFVKGGGNKTIEKGSSVALTATASENTADITWSPSAGLDNSKILNPQASPASTTLYTITVQTAAGCMATDSVTVTVFDGISIPNTFTPNGDGVNDKWDIKNLNDYQNCAVHIFDRYGGEVYSSIGYYNPWDGTIKGRRLPVGTYYYLINLNNGTPPLSGFVTLIR